MTIHKLSYRGLDHVVPAVPHVTHKVEDVGHSLGFYLLQSVVNRDERSRAAHTSTGRGGGLSASL